MRLFARLTNLIRGLASRWIGDRETGNPSAVYEAAIRERVAQYATLREAAAGVIYLRGKLERELQQRSGELDACAGQLDLAVERDDDPAALALLIAPGRAGRRRRTPHGRAHRAHRRGGRGQAQPGGVPGRDRPPARGARPHAGPARQRQGAARLHETLSGLSPEADIQALESVREHVNRLVAEVALVREGADPELERRLGIIRDTESAHSARAQLEELKRAKRASLVPMTLTPAVAPAPASRTPAPAAR